MSCTPGSTRHVSELNGSTGAPPAALSSAARAHACQLYESGGWQAIEPDAGAFLARYPHLAIHAFLQADNTPGFLDSVARLANGYTLEQVMDRERRMTFARLFRCVHSSAPEDYSPRLKELVAALKSAFDARVRARQSGDAAANLAAEWEVGELTQTTAEAICQEVGLSRCPACGRWRGRFSSRGPDICADCPGGDDALSLQKFLVEDRFDSAALLFDLANGDPGQPAQLRFLERLVYDLNEDFSNAVPGLALRSGPLAVAFMDGIHEKQPEATFQYLRRLAQYTCERAHIWRCPSCGRYGWMDGHVCAERLVDLASLSLRRPPAFADIGGHVPDVTLMPKEEWLAEAARACNANRQVMDDEYEEQLPVAFTSRGQAEFELFMSKEGDPHRRWVIATSRNASGDPAWMVLNLRHLRPNEYIQAEDCEPLYEEALAAALDAGRELPMELLLARPELIARYGLG